MKLFDSTISCKIPTNSPHQNPLIERDHLTGKMIQRGVSVGTNERSVLDISSSRSDSSQRKNRSHKVISSERKREKDLEQNFKKLFKPPFDITMLIFPRKVGAKCGMRGQTEFVSE